MHSKGIPSGAADTKIKMAAVVLISFMTILFSINSSSIWIDEGITWSLASKASFSEMLDSMIQQSGSEKQMPLHVFYEFVWIRIFGDSEIALRSSNIPFALLYMVYAYKISGAIDEKKKCWFYLLFLSYPVFISYMNEARPYIIMLAMATAIMYYSFYAPAYNAGTFTKINLCMLIGLASHMLFAVTGAIVLFGMLYRRKEEQVQVLPIFKKNWYFVLPYAGLVGYYTYTVLALPSASIGNSFTPVFINLCTCLFYLFGFGGLFLSRVDLRAFDFSALSLPMILLCAAFFTVLVGMLVIFVKGWKQIRSKAKYYMGITLLILLFFVVLGIIMHYAFWERHMISLVPVILAVFCECLALKKPPFKYGGKANILIGGGYCPVLPDFFRKNEPTVLLSA